MIRTRVCDLLGIEHPIISAPMAGTAGSALAGAVSAAGGFGLIGGSGGGPDWLRAEIQAVRARTDRPFGVGFISSFPGLDDLVQVALDARVTAIGHSFADPTPYVAAAHMAGIKVFAQVQTVAQARVAVQAGVDLIAAQGTEAGGHTGYSGTLALVPAVVDVAGAIPVVAAGGIGDGRGLAAVLVLGAEGAWIGTRFVASHEGSIAPWVKAQVVAATADDTILTHAYDLVADASFPAGIGDRVLRNDFTVAWHARDGEVLAQRAALRATIQTAIETGDARVAPARAGCASGLIQAVEPAGALVGQIVAAAEQILRARPAQILC